MKENKKILIAKTGLTFGQSVSAVIVSQIIIGLSITLFIEIPNETNFTGLKIITFFILVLYYFTVDKSRKLVFSDDEVIYNNEVEIPYDNIKYVRIKNGLIYKNLYIYKKREESPVIKCITIKNLYEVMFFLNNKKVKISEKKI